MMIAAMFAMMQLTANDLARLAPYTIYEPMARPPAAKIVWSDEFDGTALDPAKWSYDIDSNKTGWANNELQYYSANRTDNASVANGLLSITARADKDAVSKFPDWGGQAYSSARLLSKTSWTYGYYEIRAKLPCTPGMWPAIWMLPPDMKEWPDDGEIDIMEHVSKTPGIIYATLHSANYYHIKNTQRGAVRGVPDACEAFHTYQLDWRRDEARIGVDGVAYMRIRNNLPAEGKAAWPFDRPFQLILNLAVGGDWPGPVDATKLPQSFEVDYVRVYQTPAR